AVGQDLEHSFAVDEALLLGLGLEDGEDQVLLPQARRRFDLELLGDCCELVDLLFLEQLQVEARRTPRRRFVANVRHRSALLVNVVATLSGHRVSWNLAGDWPSGTTEGQRSRKAAVTSGVTSLGNESPETCQLRFSPRRRSSRSARMSCGRGASSRTIAPVDGCGKRISAACSAWRGKLRPGPRAGSALPLRAP